MPRHKILFTFLLVALFIACAEEPAERIEEAPLEAEPTPTEVKPEPEAPEEEVSKANPALLDPSLAQARSPDLYRVRFDTTKGPFTVEVDRSWSPRGADRFFNLVKIGFFQDIALFRVLDGFVVQFGISGDPEINEIWRNATIKDEPVKASNRKGFITYAKGGKDTRTTQLFINLADNVNLDQMGFPPFGQVVEGMSVVESFYSGYGEGAPRGRGPYQGRIQSEGNRYLRDEFPELDYIEKATLLD
jgi:peptidyl-prolyl cis-trans isomerase A (cyclophilin A)